MRGRPAPLWGKPARGGAEKIPIVNAAVPGPRPTWHMVGHIQSRKADLVVDGYGVVHSVDRLKIARRLSRARWRPGGRCRSSWSATSAARRRSSASPWTRWEEDAAQREAFFADCAAILALPGLRVEGLMTVAPLTDDPETVRPVFARLRSGTPCGSTSPISWRELSMGMTDDFEVAVEEGAAMVRIGRAIFGPRREEV